GYFILLRHGRFYAEACQKDPSGCEKVRKPLLDRTCAKCGGGVLWEPRRAFSPKPKLALVVPPEGRVTDIIKPAAQGSPGAGCSSVGERACSAPHPRSA